MSRGRVPTVLVGLLAGCYSPSINPNCRVSCEQGSVACPAGLACGSDGLCYEGPQQCSSQALADGGSGSGGGYIGPCASSFVSATTTVLANVQGTGWNATIDRTIAVYQGASLFEQTNVDTGDGTTINVSGRNPRLFPDSTISSARMYAIIPLDPPVIDLLTRSTPATWGTPTLVKLGATTTIGSTETISSPTATTPRHLVVLANPQTLSEWASTDDVTYTASGSYTASDLGVTSISDPDLTADGLGLVFVVPASGSTVDTIYYAARANLGDRFSPAVVLYASPGPRLWTPYLDPGCRRLYWSEIGVLRRATGS